MLVTTAVITQVIFYGSYAMWLVMPYLTKVWGISIVQAAAVVNIFDGIVAILPLGFKVILNLLGDPMIGDYYMLLWSGISSTLGLLLVTMSTPLVFSKGNGYVCSKDEPKCISDTQKTIFYAGLGLLATGMATCLTSLRPYIFKRANMMGIYKPQDVYNIRQALVRISVTRETLVQQLVEANTRIDPDSLRSRAYNWPTEHWLYRCNAVFTITLVVLVFFIKPWSFRLGISALILFVSTVMFVVKPWNRVTNEEGVLADPYARLNEEDSRIVIKTMAKNLLCSFPMWSTFVICGLVSSSGNTFFMEQAGQMDPKLGQWEVPMFFFVLFYKLANWLATHICQDIMSSNTKSTKHVITFSLSICIVCCVIAALVEKTRLDAMKRQGLINNDGNEDSVAPLSMFLMIPQFSLLAILDVAYSSSVYAFFEQQFPKSVKMYLNSIIHFVLGLGILGNVVSVYLVGEVSGKGGHQSWFQHSLNRSRLDKFYWVLALFSTINLLYYFLVAHSYSKWVETESETGEPESESGEVKEHDYARLSWFGLLPLRQ